MTFQLRPYTTEDEDFVVSSWIFSYARSRYGVAHGAHLPSTVKGESKRPDEEDWSAFWDEQKPIVLDLLSRADVQIACDPAAPHVIWGWACTSGDTVHHVLVKRSVHRASAKEERGVWSVTTGLSGDIYRGLLGPRFERDCGYTFELVDMRRPELRAQGITVPRGWYSDTTFFAREYFRTRKAA